MTLNTFCDKKAEQARLLRHKDNPDPFFPDQKNGITRLGERFHGSPREAILDATHDLDLEQYICAKTNWLPEILILWIGRVLNLIYKLLTA